MNLSELDPYTVVSAFIQKENLVVGAAAAFGDAQTAMMEDGKRQTTRRQGCNN